EVEELAIADADGRAGRRGQERLATQQPRLLEVLGLGAQKFEERAVSHLLLVSLAMNHKSDATQLCHGMELSSPATRQYRSMLEASGGSPMRRRKSTASAPARRRLSRSSSPR